MSSEPNRHPSPYSQPAEPSSGQYAAEPTSDPVGTQSAGASTGAQLEHAPASAPGVPHVPSPAVDLIENSEELWVFIDLPGFQPEEIQLQGDARTIHVRASRPSEIEDGRNVMVHERAVQVERTIQLPVAVDVGEIDAIFEHGVCKMTIPKAASERYRDIELRTAE